MVPPAYLLVTELHELKKQCGVGEERKGEREQRDREEAKEKETRSIPTDRSDRACGTPSGASLSFAAIRSRPFALTDFLVATSTPVPCSSFFFLFPSLLSPLSTHSHSSIPPSPSIFQYPHPLILLPTHSFPLSPSAHTHIRSQCQKSRSTSRPQTTTNMSSSSTPPRPLKSSRTRLQRVATPLPIACV